LKFNTMDDFDFAGKKVLLRVDINSPVINGIVQDSPRIKAHAETIKGLVHKRAKIIILAHQGRPGDKDFTHLEQHARILSRYVGKRITFVEDVYGFLARKSIRGMREKDVIMLDNVRMLKDEMDKSIKDFSKTSFIRILTKEADVFVNDAFSVSHRAQASVVGFSSLPRVAGRVMERELRALGSIDKPVRPVTFIFGGAKPEDRLAMMKKKIKKIDYVLTGGTIANLFLIARKTRLGKTEEFLESKGYTDFMPAVKSLSKYSKIRAPSDVAVMSHGNRVEIGIDRLPVEKDIEDIGKKTIAEYKKIINKSKTIIVGGTMGVIEKKQMQDGTREILKAVAGSSAFTLIGGGHAGEALDMFKINKKKISYISLAGGALVAYLSGEKLPGVEILRQR
jgi:phosphoglycerate kinase